MNRWFRTGVATIGCLLAAAPLAAEDVNRVVLRINDEIATLYDYELRKSGDIARILADPGLGSAEQQERLRDVGRDVMTSLFGELLLLSYAEQNGYRVSERDVDEALLQMQQQRGIRSQEELEQALAASGMTLQDLRSNVKRELIWNQVIGREVQGQIEIGDDEVRAFYRNNGELFAEPEQRHIQEIIVLESSERSDDELRQLADRISGRLEAGATLEEVAGEYQEEGVTTGVIDLGWLRSEELGEALADTAWDLEPGAISRPIAGRGGYHILQVVEVREAQQRPLNEVEDVILRNLRGQRFNDELRKFMATIEQQAYIREDLPEDAVGYRRMSEGFELDDELEIFRAPIASPAAVPEAAEAEGTGAG